MSALLGQYCGFSKMPTGVIKNWFASNGIHFLPDWDVVDVYVRRHELDTVTYLTPGDGCDFCTRVE